MQKNDNLLKTKTTLKLKYKLDGEPVLAFNLPGGNSPLCLLLVMPLQQIR